jgi:hypothetical protein
MAGQVDGGAAPRADRPQVAAVAEDDAVPVDVGHPQEPRVGDAEGRRGQPQPGQDDQAESHGSRLHGGEPPSVIEVMPVIRRKRRIVWEGLAKVGVGEHPLG